MQVPWIQPRHIDHPVGDSNLRFYEITGLKLVVLKDLIRVCIDSLVQLQRSPREDASSEEIRDVERTEIVDGKMAFMPKSLTTVKKGAVATDLARYHDEQRRSILQALISNVIDGKTYRDLVSLIVASLRDEFPKVLDRKEMDELVESIPAGTFVELMGGVAKANTKLFGPFEEVLLKVMGTVQERLERLTLVVDPEED